MKKLSIPTFIIVFILNLIFVTQSFAQPNDTIPLYSFENMEMDFIPSKSYDIDYEVRLGVFPIPIDNAIGVNSLGHNALSYITFGKNKLSVKSIKKGFGYYFSGDCRFMPVFSKDWIAWGQTRRFFLFDLKNKTHKYYHIRAVEGRWEYIDDVWAVNPDKLQFLFLITSDIEGSTPDTECYLKHISFDQKEPVESKLFLLGNDNETFWTIAAVHGKDIFLNNPKTNQLFAFDLDFKQQTNHTLVDLLNKNKDIADCRFWPLKIHPGLPIAVVGGKDKLWLVNWGKDTPEAIPIINQPEFGLWADFSPDGKWLLMYHKEYLTMDNDKTNLYILPVNKDLPHYLGHPIEMQSHYEKYEEEYIWSTNPLGFNVISFDKLIHWEIEDK